MSYITHEFLPPYINDDSEILILGSLPSIKSREEGFYYAHKRNRFFLTLATLFNEEEPISIMDRKSFLNKHKIALYDVVYACDIHMSSDSSIKNVTPINIKCLLNAHKSIKVVAVNGGKAKQLFDKHLLKFINKDIKIIYLPSTSPANAKMSLAQLVEQYKQIIEYN